MGEPEEEESVGVEEGDCKSEGLTLFREIAETSNRVLDLVEKLKSKFDQKEYSVEKGLSLLCVKNIMLVQYLENLTNFMMLKTCGKQIEGNPVIDRLIELRVTLERIRPLEQKLRYQIDKLIKMDLTGVGNENDPNSFKANPANMISSLREGEGSSESAEENEEGGSKPRAKKSDTIRERSGLYVPPKIAAVHYDGDEVERKANAIERARRFALNSSVLQELKEEYLDIPVELATTNSAKQKHDKQQKYKQEYEETYFTRLPISKEEKRRSKKLSTVGTLGDEITKFEDISILNGGELKSSKKRKRAKGNKAKGKSKGKKRRKK